MIEFSNIGWTFTFQHFWLDKFTNKKVESVQEVIIWIKVDSFLALKNLLQVSMIIMKSTFWYVSGLYQIGFPESFINRCFKVFFNKVHIIKENFLAIKKELVLLVPLYLVEIVDFTRELNYKTQSKGSSTVIHNS